MKKLSIFLTALIMLRNEYPEVNSSQIFTDREVHGFISKNHKNLCESVLIREQY